MRNLFLSLLGVTRFHFVGDPIRTIDLIWKRVWLGGVV